jgi:hypothetical protein
LARSSTAWLTLHRNALFHGHRRRSCGLTLPQVTSPPLQLITS